MKNEPYIASNGAQTITVWAFHLAQARRKAALALNHPHPYVRKGAPQ